MSIVFAKVDAFIGHNGIPTRIQTGEVWDSENEIVIAHPEFFDPVTPPVGVRPKKRAQEFVAEGGKT